MINFKFVSLIFVKPNSSYHGFEYHSDIFGGRFDDGRIQEFGSPLDEKDSFKQFQKMNFIFEEELGFISEYNSDLKGLQNEIKDALENGDLIHRLYSDNNGRDRHIELIFHEYSGDTGLIMIKLKYPNIWKYFFEKLTIID